MKKEESKYLLNGKLKSGKGYKQARQEIKNLKKSQVDFKELKKELKSLERELINKDKLIEKLQKSHFKNILPRAEEKINQINNSKNGEATLHEVNRVLNLFSLEKRIGLHNLTKTCGMKSKKVKGILNFLVRNNMIKEVNEGKTLMLERT